MAANQFKARKEWKYIEYPDASHLTPHGLYITRLRYEPKLQKMVRVRAVSFLFWLGSRRWQVPLAPHSHAYT